MKELEVFKLKELLSKMGKYTIPGMIGGKRRMNVPVWENEFSKNYEKNFTNENRY